MSDSTFLPAAAELGEDHTGLPDQPLLDGPTRPEADVSAQSGVLGTVVGVLVGFQHDGVTPLVTHPLQSGTTAVAALTTVDLSREHLGHSVVLIFERGDSTNQPIVVGRLRPQGAGLPRTVDHVELDVDGERLVVSAKEQIVLRCGRASITLTKAGKILISGEYVSTRSSGVNRIQGGSVQLN